MFKSIGMGSILGFLLNTVSIPVIAQPAYPTFEQAGFLFELIGCDNTEGSDVPLTCEFRVENTEDNRKEFHLYADKSRVIDAEGNEILGLTANLGNREEESQTAAIELIKGIPVKGSITFGKSPIGTIRLVDLRCSPRYNAEYFNVEFPFTQ